MLKKIIFSSILLACTTLALADTPAPTRWTFSWSGLYSTYQGDFLSDLTIDGTFGGVDANHDGVITLNELTELNIRGTDYATCHDNCGVTSFAYVRGGELNFLAGAKQFQGLYSIGIVTEQRYEAGVGATFITTEGSRRDEFSFLITPQTVSTITQLTPVPEPESMAMLGAGLLLLAGVARSLKKAGR